VHHATESGQVETTYAELETGKWLFAHNVPLRFNVPCGKRGEDYDLDVIYPDVTAAADTKCKIETTKVDAKSVGDSLHEAREQLPENRPGAIFVKIPARWLNTPDILHAVVDVTKHLLRNTGRIVSVKYYSPVRIIENDIVRALFRFREITNPQHRHVATRLDWDVWGTHTAQDGTKPLPDFWIRVIDP
jgi:hypothetical protein